jgi:hypothetical protein
MTTPKLPTLRDLHKAWSYPDAGGEKVECVGTYKESDCIAVYGREYIPGDGARFDARAAARRLLADAREAGFK